jgi:multicomponent K+:H+ antiporter subunit G
MIGGTSFAELIVSALIVLGGAFALVGSWGLVRLPSLMERLHGPTKATTLGLGALLVASVVWFQLFMTAPISANMIAKAHLHRQRQGDAAEAPGPAGTPAPPPGAADWATHEAPHDGTPGDFAGD